MVSFPDDLLARLDRHAEAYGTTRSRLLQDLAGRELALATAEKRREVVELLAGPGRHGGDAAAAVRAARRSR